MNYVDLLEVRKIYERGENITEYLKIKFNEKVNTSDIIEIAYDLQAGSYIEHANSNRHTAKLYASELAKILIDHISAEDSLLDVGSGEMTTLTLMLNEMITTPKDVLAFDISWSRLIKGKGFYKENINQGKPKVSAFVADLKQIPLHTSCVDVVTSSHALEPNGKNLQDIITELFRVTKKKLILFEPSYELNSPEGRNRMDKLGYIKGIQAVVERLGGRALDIIPLSNIVNTLNPTVCYIIEPPRNDTKTSKDRPTYCVPGTDFVLEKNRGFFDSKETGLTFPVLDDVPILKNQYGILATVRS